MGRQHGTIATATRKLAVLSAAALLTLGASACDLPYGASSHDGRVANAGYASDTYRGAPESSLAATPELDSALLFGVALVGAAGFVSRRK